MTKEMMETIAKAREWLEPYNTFDEVLEILNDYELIGIEKLNFSKVLEIGHLYSLMRTSEYPPIKTLHENHLNLFVYITQNCLIFVSESENILEDLDSYSGIKDFRIIENFNIKKVTDTNKSKVV